MSFLPLDRATTLKAAFQACDLGSLKGEASQKYYVDLSAVRSGEAIRNVSTRLDFLDAGVFDTLLFTGHRGCGKSTELRRIQNQWEQDYRVIYLEADEELDVNDIEYTDLYLVIIKHVADDLTRLNLRFDAKLLRSFEEWFKEITEETEESVNKSFSLETSLEAKAEVPFIFKLLAKLQAQIKGSHQQKQIIRQKMERNVRRLKSDINLLLKDGFEKLTAQYRKEERYQKGFLVIMDNLDRIAPKIGDSLYFDYAAQLQELKCTVIYTVPISVVYSDKNLNNAFSRPNIVPMVDIYQFDSACRDLVYNEAAVKGLASVVARRIDLAAVFASSKLLAQLVVASGGHVRQLMQMTATACLTAATRNHNKIQADDITYAIRQEQFNFERVIPSHHYAL